MFNVLTSDLMNISPYHLIEWSSDSDLCPELLAQRSRHCVAPAEQVTDVVAGSHAAALAAVDADLKLVLHSSPRGTSDISFHTGIMINTRVSSACVWACVLAPQAIRVTSPRILFSCLKSRSARFALTGPYATSYHFGGR